MKLWERTTYIIQIREEMNSCTALSQRDRYGLTGWFEISDSELQDKSKIKFL